MSETATPNAADIDYATAAIATSEVFTELGKCSRQRIAAKTYGGEARIGYNLFAIGSDNRTYQSGTSWYSPSVESDHAGLKQIDEMQLFVIKSIDGFEPKTPAAPTTDAPLIDVVSEGMGEGWRVERFTRVDTTTGARQTGFRVNVTLTDGDTDRSSIVWMNNALIDACDFASLLPMLADAMVREIADRPVYNHASRIPARK